MGVHAKMQRMPALPPYLFFDLDDTLLDYSASGRRCWQELFLEYAPRFGVTVEQLTFTHQQTSDWYWSNPERHRTGRLDLRSARRQVMQLILEKLGLNERALGDEMADAFTLRREEMFAPFPGAIETLQEFKRGGIRMGLITNGNGEFQRNKIRRFDLTRFFEAVIIEGEFGAGKPDRRVFLAAMESLGAAPAQAWMVGDDLGRDIQPAQELGLGTVWVDFENAGLPAVCPISPMLIVRSITELLQRSAWLH
jgi:putative hydrolase of the HAD superfamily